MGVMDWSYGSELGIEVMDWSYGSELEIGVRDRSYGLELWIGVRDGSSSCCMLLLDRHERTLRSGLLCFQTLPRLFAFFLNRA
jgi:hypothetical protein